MTGLSGKAMAVLAAALEKNNLSAARTVLNYMQRARFGSADAKKVARKLDLRQRRKQLAEAELEAREEAVTAPPAAALPPPPPKPAAQAVPRAPRPKAQTIPGRMYKIVITEPGSDWMQISQILWRASGEKNVYTSRQLQTMPFHVEGTFNAAKTAEIVEGLWSYGATVQYTALPAPT